MASKIFKSKVAAAPAILPAERSLRGEDTPSNP
jgi:hypothetical protein